MGALIENRLRVALYHPYPQRMGGSQQITLLLARQLPATGVTAVLVCPDEGPLTAAARAQGTEVAICVPPASWRASGQSSRGIRAWLSIRHARDLARYWRQLCSLLRDYRIAVLHCNDIRAVVMGAPAGRRADIPTVWHVHRAPPGKTASWLSLLPMRLVTRTVFVSPSMIDYWAVPRRLLRSRIVIPNGLEVAAIEPYLKDGTRPLIVVVGALSVAKGQDVLLAALPAVLASIPNAHCWIVGKDWGDGSFERHLREMARHLRLDDRIDFLGERTDAAALLAASDCVVIPSRSETFGMVALEAMAQGKPVIAAATGGLRDVVIDGETGLLFPAGQSADLARAIVRILNEPELARCMGEAGKLHVAQDFSAARMAERFASLYRSLLRGRG